MKSILRVVLDRRNHPLLIHCNHGKVSNQQAPPSTQHSARNTDLCSTAPVASLASSANSRAGT
jgi:hypothetical protein